MRRYIPYVGIALGLAIAVYALFFAQSAEDAIRDQLDRLEEAVALEPGSQPVIRAARVKGAFKGLFVKDVTFDVPELDGSDQGRDELVSLAAAAPRLFQQAHVDLDGLAIDLAADEKSAIAVGEAVIMGAQHGQAVRRDTRTVSIRFDEVDGDWLIVSLSVSPPGS